MAIGSTKRLRSALLIALAVTASSVWAGVPPPGRVCDRVCDAVTGAPIPGVRVVSRALGMPRGKFDACCPDEVLTDSTGQYEVVAYSFGLTCSAPGYTTIRVRWDQVKPIHSDGVPRCLMAQDILLKRRR